MSEPATTSPGDDVEFVCASCGHRAVGTVPGVARDEAMLRVARATCPKCGQRNEAAVKPLLQSRINPALAWGTLIGLTGTSSMCVARHYADAWDVFAGAAMAAVGAILIAVIPVTRALKKSDGVVWKKS